MRNIVLVIQREYVSRVKRWGFLVTTLLGPLSILILLLFSAYMGSYTGGAHTIAIVDQNHLLNKESLPGTSDLLFAFPDAKPSEAEGLYQNGLFEMFVVVPKVDSLKKLDALQLTYYAQSNPGIRLKEQIAAQIQKAIETEKLNANGLPKNFLQDLTVNVSMKNAGNESSIDYADVAALAGFVVGILIYMSLMMYGTMIMRGVAEEKQNRIAEVLLSCVKPFELMMGKVVAIGLVGLSQALIWFLLVGLLQSGLAIGSAQPLHDAGSISAQNPGELQQAISEALAGIHQLPLIQLALSYLFYFVFGYFLYGSLFAAVGSAVGDQPDNQSLTFPIMLPIILSFFISISSLSNPESNLVIFASIFPLSSPIVMPGRIAFHPPAWQVALSMSLLIATFLFTVFLAAKIYRANILLTGKRISLKDLIRTAFR